MSGAWPYVAAILPTILVAIFFYFIVKSILEGDRRERIAQKKYEQEQEGERSRSEAAPGDPEAADDTRAAGVAGEPKSPGKSPSES